MEKHPHIPARNMLAQMVLGGTDGVIEVSAVVAGLNGAGVPFWLIFLTGIILAFGGSISMLVSGYLSETTNQRNARIDAVREGMEIETEPEEEEGEMRDLLKAEGYSASTIDSMVSDFKQNKRLWLRAMLRHEIGINQDDGDGNGLLRALPIPLAYFFAALVPVLPFVLVQTRMEALLMLVALAFAVLFVLGSTKFVEVRHPDVKGGLVAAILGTVAAILVYYLGTLVGVV